MEAVLARGVSAFHTKVSVFGVVQIPDRIQCTIHCFFGITERTELLRAPNGQTNRQTDRRPPNAHSHSQSQSQLQMLWGEGDEPQRMSVVL